MIHRIGDGDPQATETAKLRGEIAALHAKFDQMLHHLAVIAGAVKAPDPNLQPAGSQDGSDKSG
jgi:hypothetical protein